MFAQTGTVLILLASFHSIYASPCDIGTDKYSIICSNAAFTDFTDIPGNFSRNITSLEIRYSNIVSLKNLSLYTNLEVLVLSSNEIEYFDSTMNEISALTKLRHLDLSNNTLGAFDLDVLSDMDNLTTLILRNNPNLFLNDIAFTGLQELNLDGCNLFNIPFGIVGFRSLKILSLKDNYLNELVELKTLSELQEVFIDGNAIPCVNHALADVIVSSKIINECVSEDDYDNFDGDDYVFYSSESESEEVVDEEPVKKEQVQQEAQPIEVIDELKRFEMAVNEMEILIEKTQSIVKHKEVTLSKRTNDDDEEYVVVSATVYNVFVTYILASTIGILICLLLILAYLCSQIKSASLQTVAYNKLTNEV